MVPAPILNVLENNLNVPITNMQRMIALLTLRNRTIVQAGKLGVAVHLSHSGSNTMWAVAGLIINALPLNYVMAFRLAKPVIRRRIALHRALLTQLALIQAAPGGARPTGMTQEQLEAATDACAAAKAAKAKAVAASSAADSSADGAPSNPPSKAPGNGPESTSASASAPADAHSKPKCRIFLQRLAGKCMFWKPRTDSIHTSRRNEAALVYALLCARQFAEGDAAVVALYGTPNIGFNLRKCIVRFHGASRNQLMVRLLAKGEGGWEGVQRDQALLRKAEAVAHSITAQARLIPLLTGLDLLL